MTIEESANTISKGLADASDGFKKMQIILVVCCVITSVAILIITLNLNSK